MAPGEGEDYPAFAGGAFSADAVTGAAFLAGDNPVFLLELDSRRILACGGGVTRVFGYEPGELIGRDTRILHVDERAFREFGRVSEAAIARNGGSYHGLFDMRRKDGTSFPSEHFVQVVGDGASVPRAVISVVRDLGGAHQSSSPASFAVSEEVGFRQLAENLPGAVFQRVTTPDGQHRYTFLAGSLFRDHEIDPEPMRADPEQFLGRVDPRDRTVFRTELERSDVFMRPLDMELRLRTHGDHFVWLRVLSQPKRLDDGTIVRDGFALDITRQRSAEEHLHYLATHDPLTGTINRFQFLERLRIMLQEPATESRGVVVASINIRGMTRVNHAHGRSGGDAVLRQLCARLRAALGEAALLGRCLGDHFAVAVVGTGDERQAGELVARLQAIFAEPFAPGYGASAPVSARLGIARYPQDGGDADAVLDAADVALNRARRQTDGPYAFYDPVFGQELRQRAEREEALAEAIETGAIVPYFQPQVSLADGSVIGFEALARWPRPDGTVVSPGVFIPVAEECGLMVGLGLGITRAVLRRIRAWEDSGLTVPPVAINCSARQVADAAFERGCRDAIVEAGVDPTRIALEITESSILDDYAATERKMHAMTALGVTFSIDDFGTGYSSLGYLARLPFHVLKIDRTFVADVVDDTRQRSIVSALIQMARALGLYVIAEGVETAEQEAQLHHLGCDGAQGYYYSRPLPAEAIEPWLAPK